MAEISRSWTFKYPPSGRETQCIEIKDSNLPDWQQSVNYKGDSNQLEIVLYKTDKRKVSLQRTSKNTGTFIS